MKILIQRIINYVGNGNDEEFQRMADLTERWLNMPSNQDVQNRVDVIDAHNIVGLYLDAKHTHNVVWLRNAQAAVNRMKSRLHAIYGNAA